MSKEQTGREALQELLNHQQVIKEGSSQVEALQSAIHFQEKVLLQHQAQLPDLESLEQQRENLLADIATGSAEPAALDLLDELVETKQAESLELAQLITRCHKTLVGLNRKLQAEIESLSQLQAQSGKHLRAYLLAEAESEGETYVKLGADLVKKFTRLDAISLLLRGLDYQTMKSPNAATMSLPAFNLEAFKGHTAFNNPGTMFREPDTHALRLEWLAAEKENLRSLSIEIE